MTDKSDEGGTDPEIAAISLVYSALKSLNADAQNRVIQYVVGKLGLGHEAAEGSHDDRNDSRVSKVILAHAPAEETQEEARDTADGVSPVAKKWMQRNDLSVSALSKLFSIGDDEIDVIAKSVPGKSKKTKAHSVILLKGVAAYLAGGAARITHQQIKETSLHYDAYDSPNFAAYLKDFAAEVSGTKESGYTLTPRGLSAATELVKQMTQPQETKKG